ncbi:MAG: ABC transporter permease [Nitratireductor sp.]|nr:ABC transporter permease [Nitratireductor sp.]
MSTFFRLLFNLLVVVIYLYLLAPLIVVVLFSFSDRSFFSFPPTGFSFQWYVAAWQSGAFTEPAIRSLVLAVVASLFAAVLAIPACLGLRRYKGRRWAGLLEFLLISPLVVPALIIGIALLYFFLRLNLIDTWIAMLAAHTLLVFPFMFRSIFVSAVGIQSQYEEASEILGASPWTTFRNVVFPFLLPGITSGAIFAFIISFDQFTVSLFISQVDQITLPVALYRYLYDVNDPVAAAVSSALVGFGLILAIALQRLGLLRHVGGQA